MVKLGQFIFLKSSHTMMMYWKEECHCTSIVQGIGKLRMEIPKFRKYCPIGLRILDSHNFW